jgi:hypothetical protein
VVLNPNFELQKSDTNSLRDIQDITDLPDDDLEGEYKSDNQHNNSKAETESSEEENGEEENGVEE